MKTQKCQFCGETIDMSIAACPNCGKIRMVEQICYMIGESKRAPVGHVAVTEKYLYLLPNGSGGLYYGPNRPLERAVGKYVTEAVSQKANKDLFELGAQIAKTDLQELRYPSEDIGRGLNKHKGTKTVSFLHPGGETIHIFFGSPKTAQAFYDALK